MKHWLKNFIHAIGFKQLIICSILNIIFFYITFLIKDKNFTDFEEHFLDFLQETINPLWGNIFKICYSMTGTGFTAFIVAGILGFLIYKKYWQEAKIFSVATLGILIIINQILKPYFWRRRPLDRLVDVDGRSFPSGHAAGNLVLYFYLSYLLAKHYPKLTVYIYGFATLWLGIIGFSPLYVRVHWPSDIIAGYTVGYIWLTICLAWLKMCDISRR